MKAKMKPYLMLIPAMVPLLAIFAAGLVISFFQSLGYFPAVGLQRFTLKYYKEVITDAGFLSSLKFSLWIAFASSFLSVLLGVLLAYSILVSKYKKRFEEIVYKLPIIVPHAVAVLLVSLLLSQSGMISRVLYHLRILQEPSQFPGLLYDRKGIGIILAYLWKGTPFIAMVVYTVLSNINDTLGDAAMNLGATKKQTFLYILLPLMMPSILSSFIILFAFSFGAFEVPFLLGPTSPRVLPVRAYIEYIHPDWTNRPYTMTINMILTALSLGFIWIYYKTFKLISKYNR